jgi:hypothetical protein
MAVQQPPSNTLKMIKVSDFHQKKRSHFDHYSFNEILQILSRTIFKTIPINQLVTPTPTETDADSESNQVAHF